MNTLWNILGDTALIAIPAVLNAIWQAALMALAVGCLLKASRRVNATTAGLVWWIAMTVATALPLVNASKPLTIVTAPERRSPTQREPVALPAPSASTVATSTRQPSDDHPTQTAGEQPAQTASAIPMGAEPLAPLEKPVHVPTKVRIAEPSTVEAPTLSNRFTLPATSLAAPLMLAWMLASVLLLTRLATGWRKLQQLKRASIAPPEALRQRFEKCLVKTGVNRRVRLGISGQISTPLAAGLRRPMVLLPAKLVAELSEAEFDAVIIHELAHLRRWDDWTNLLQQAIQSVLCPNPVVWWMGRQIALQREIACDDWVIALTGQPRDYATCLTCLMELAHPPRLPLPAPGAWMTRGQLRQRVVSLLDKRRNGATHSSNSVTLLSAVLMVCVVGTVLKWGPALALAEQTGDTQTPTQPNAVAKQSNPRTVDAPLRFSIRQVHPQSDQLAARKESLENPPDGYEWRTIQDVDSARKVLVAKPATLFEEMDRHIQKARAEASQVDQKPMIIVEFDARGASLFEELTRKALGERLAFILNGRIVSTPVVQAIIESGIVQISGGFTLEEAKQHAASLQDQTRQSGAATALPPRGRDSTSGNIQAWLDRYALLTGRVVVIERGITLPEFDPVELDALPKEEAVLRMHRALRDAGVRYQKVGNSFVELPPISANAGEDREQPGTGRTDATTPAPVSTSDLAQKEKERDLIREELALMEKLVATQEQLYKNGRVAESDVIKARRDLIALKRQLLTVDDEIAQQRQKAKINEESQAHAKAAAEQLERLEASLKKAESELKVKSQKILEEMDAGKRVSAPVVIGQALTRSDAGTNGAEPLRALPPRSTKTGAGTRQPLSPAPRAPLPPQPPAQNGKEQAEKENAAEEENRQKAEMAAAVAEIVRKDSSPAVRKSAVFGVAKWHPDAAHLLAESAKNDPDDSVRQTAFSVLTGMHNASSTRELLALLDYWKEPGIRSAVVTGLLEYLPAKGNQVATPSAAVDKLIQMATEESDVNLRRQSIRQAGSAQGETGVKALLTLYDAIKDGSIRSIVVEELGRRGDAVKDKLLEIARKDADESCRLAAMQHLGGKRLPFPSGQPFMGSPGNSPIPPPPVNSK